MRRESFGRPIIVAAVCASALPLACGSPDTLGTRQGTGGGGAGATGGAGGDLYIPLPDASIGAGGTSIDGAVMMALDGGASVATCGSTTMTPNRAPVDVFVVLDRSASMYYSIAGDCYCTASVTGGTTNVCPSAPGCTSRWDAVSAGLTQTSSLITTINWGLELYPTPGGGVCTVTGALQLPFGVADSASVLRTTIRNNPPAGGNTPTAVAIQAAAAYVPTVDDGNKKAILLATDGIPNCYQGDILNTDDMASTLQAIGTAYTLGLPVYVVGIGPSVGNLDAMALQGGTGHYYPATSPEQLAEALIEISRIIATSCTFRTPTAPPDDAKVWVYVDKTFVPESALDGWSFGGDPTTIVLTGPTCQSLLDGKSTTVEVIFGCKDEPPPPAIP